MCLRYYAQMQSLWLALHRFLGLREVGAGPDALFQLTGWNLVVEGFPPLDFHPLRRRTRAQTGFADLMLGGAESVIIERIGVKEIADEKT